jgi:hypothetical protein
LPKDGVGAGIKSAWRVADPPLAIVAQDSPSAVCFGTRLSA